MAVHLSAYSFSQPNTDPKQALPLEPLFNSQSRKVQTLEVLSNSTTSFSACLSMEKQKTQVALRDRAPISTQIRGIVTITVTFYYDLPMYM